MFSLLHISDLHRSPNEPIDNDTLIASLLADRDRYVTETPPVPLPDALVVSGDIIQGARLGAPGYQAEVREQYDVAYEFLATLTERLFRGDRRNVVLVPGNHDVSWNDARSAMTAVPRDQEPGDFPACLAQAGARHRWSWNERQVYEITNWAAYNARLDEYWTFVEKFYGGTPLTYPVNRERGFNIFELDNGRIAVAAFESVHGNDCYSYQGCIKEGAIPRCALAMRDSTKQYLLRIAVWHHSVQGPPSRDDYMDIQAVHEMIGNGFRLGLHGHQHSADVAAHYIHVPQSQTMAVVAAGSLCAGSRELPRGVDRQYNVVSLSDDHQSARAHVREMCGGYQFGRSLRGQMALDGAVELAGIGPPTRSGSQLTLLQWICGAALYARRLP